MSKFILYCVTENRSQAVQGIFISSSFQCTAPSHHGEMVRCCARSTLSPTNHTSFTALSAISVRSVHTATPSGVTLRPTDGPGVRRMRLQRTAFSRRSATGRQSPRAPGPCRDQVSRQPEAKRLSAHATLSVRRCFSGSSRRAYLLPLMSPRGGHLRRDGQRSRVTKHRRSGPRVY